MNSESFAGRLALVTGSSGAIGTAVVESLRAAGARVVCADRSGTVPIEQAGSLQSQAIALDVTDRAQVMDLFARIETGLGPVDTLVNVAGVVSHGSAEALTEAEWDRVIDINLKGTMLCTQAVIAPMRAQGGGAVVNVASMAAKRVSYAGAANYTASKAGVLGFTWHAAFELGAYKIRVNAVCPGPTLTGMSSKRTAEQRAETAARIPLGRWVTPEDVSNAILFLSSDEAAMCTGTSLDVDGGILVSNGSSYDEYFSVRT